MLDKLTSIRGVQFSIGPELGRGGEGIVYGVNGRADLAIKVYKKEKITDERRKKLRQMVTMTSPQMAKHAAWPVDLVDSGEFAVVMPRVNGIEIHDLYGPKSRMVKMPKATFRFLIMAAYNLCAALHEIHQAGAVVGDFNQRNILINESAGVSFVDCDSFQIRNGAQLYKCTVGMPDQLAPELHGADLTTVLRSPNHDNFTLAVLIFQLMFIGRHPFAGVGGPDDISDAIRRYLFAFGKRAQGNGIRPPPHVPPADTVPLGIFALFERAFAPDSANAVRPTPTEWAKQLQSFLNSIIKCRVNPVHEYVSNRPTCPWCDLRLTLFLSDGRQVFQIDAATTNELANKLEAARPYMYNFTLPATGPIVPASLPDNLDRKSGAFWFGIAMGLLAVVGLFAGYWILAIPVGFWAWILVTDEKRKSPRAEFLRKLEQEIIDAQKRQNAIEENLRMIHDHYVQDFESTRRRVAPLKAEYNGLPARRQRQMDDLRQRLREVQLEKYLDGYFISSAGIPGIGTKRLATLRGYGIETAGDVNWKMQVPGFGSDLVGKLLAWRKSREHGFHFNPNAQIDPLEVQKVDATLQIRRNEIEAELHSINGQLDARTRQVRANLEIAGMELPAAACSVAQARVNLDALDRPTQVPPAQGTTNASNSVGIGFALLIGLAVTVILGIAVLSQRRETTVQSQAIVTPPPTVAQPVTGSVTLSTNVNANLAIQAIRPGTEEPAKELISSTINANNRIIQNLFPGRYRITFTAEGWQQSKKLDVEVAAGRDTPVEATFNKVDLYFTSSPTGALVKEGSIPLGTTPFRATGINVEEHKFVFCLPGRPDGVITATIVEMSQIAHYSWPTGNVLVTTSPNGAEVWEQGVKLGITPLNLPQVPIGDLQFTIVADGFAREEVRGTVKSDLTLNLDVPLTDIRPAKIAIVVAADGKRLRIVNVGNRLAALKRILVRGAGESVVEEIAADIRLNPGDSANLQSKTTITQEMAISIVGEPKTIEETCEWEPVPKITVPSPFTPKSITAKLYRYRKELVISNQASALLRIQYILIVHQGSKSPIRVNVDRNVAAKRSIRIDLQTRIDEGDSVLIATEPGVPRGAIEFTSF